MPLGLMHDKTGCDKIGPIAHAAGFGRATTLVNKAKVHSAMSGKPAEKSQVEKFRELAREIETVDSEEPLNAAIKKVAKSPPPPKHDEKAGKKPR